MRSNIKYCKVTERMFLDKKYVTKKRNEQPFPVRRLFSAQNPFHESIVFDFNG